MAWGGADDHGPADEGGIVELLDGSEERVDVDVEDRRGQGISLLPRGSSSRSP
jgi:hypothetical protein